MNRENNYQLSLIWALPVVASLFLLITVVSAPQSPHVFLLFKTLLLCLGFSSISSFVYRRMGVLGISVFAAVISIIALGLTPVVGVFVFWGLVISCAGAELRYFVKNVSMDRVILVGVAALALSAVLLTCFGLGEYSQINNEAKLLKSHLHIDTLYHTAIAAMIKNYHVVSHGLHGLGDLEYHFGSHLFFAAVSNLGLMSAFEAYNYLYILLIVSLLGIMIIGVGEELLPSRTDRDFYNKLAAYMFLFLGTGVLAGGSLLSRFALWPSFFQSESYTLSVVLLLSLFSVLLAGRISVGIRLPLILVLVGLMSLSKISTGFCALALLGAWALFSNEKLWSKAWRLRWGILFLSALVFLFLFQYINPGMSDAKIDPMQFIRSYVDFHGPFWLTVVLFILLHFIFPILALVFYASSYFGKSMTMVVPAWYMVGIFLSLLIGIFVLFMLSVMGGSGFYFANVSMFMALPVLLCIPQAAGGVYQKFSKVFLAFAIILFLIYAPGTLLSGAKSFLVEVKQELPDTTLGHYIRNLHVIRDDPTSVNSVVYIPRTETGYWKSMFCRGTGYLIPAISQRPALYAWPSNECYGFLCGPRFHSKGLCEISQQSFTDEQLIGEARKLGFDQVDIVTLSGIRRLH